MIKVKFPAKYIKETMQGFREETTVLKDIGEMFINKYAKKHINPETDSKFKNIDKATQKWRDEMVKYNKTDRAYERFRPLVITGQYVDSIKYKILALNNKIKITIKPGGVHKRYRGAPKGKKKRGALVGKKNTTNQVIATQMKKLGYDLFVIGPKLEKRLMKIVSKGLNKYLRDVNHKG